MVGCADGDNADGNVVVVDTVDDFIDGVIATDGDDGGVAGGDGGFGETRGIAGTGGFDPFAADAEFVEAAAQLILEVFDLSAPGGWVNDVVIHRVTACWVKILTWLRAWS